jgi:hypothetical protein
MEPTELDEIKSALQAFRLDVIKALAGIEVEIFALQMAVLPGNGPNLIDEGRLQKLRQKASLNLHKFVDEYAQRIAPAHELR